MSRGRLLFTAAIVVALSLLAGTDARAQGVTTGGVSGTVVDDAGAPIPSVQVQVVNRETGYTSSSTTREDGRYTVGGLEVGLRYAVIVRRIGFGPETREDVRVSLGQTARENFQLKRQAAVLGEVVVTSGSATDDRISPTKTGIGTTLGDSSLRRFPSLNRDFTDFVQGVPQISNSGPGLSGGGENNRFNNIQIDGASENDMFGLGSTGQPGGQANGKSISVESVKEYQVLLSPFDVRQGNFAGAQINAVTKSGTNNLHGSAYWYNRNQNYSRNLPEIRENVFARKQYGFTLGGPILKDRIHFFINPEFQKLEVPASGPYVGQPASAKVPMYVTQADIDRFTQILEGYGLTPGSAGAIQNANPLTNIFGRLDVRLPASSRLVLHYNYGRAEDDNFGRSTNPTSGTFSLSSNAFEFTSNKRGVVAHVYTNFAGGARNELLIGSNRIRDERAPLVREPQVTVTALQPSGNRPTLRAGGEAFSHANALEQDILEITNNFSFPVGSHEITLGTKNEFYKFKNLFGQSLFGTWTFDNLNAFQAGTSSGYTGGVPLAPSGEAAVQFKSATYGLYVQDVWQTSPRLVITAGLRVDLPSLRTTPDSNAILFSQVGRITNEKPRTQPHWSPRVGFNWDMTGDQRNQLRGGAGIFVGRPAYVWLGNLMQNSGVAGVANFTCRSTDSPPAFNAQTIASPPQACGNGLTARDAGEINLADRNLKFPSNARASLGYDRRLLGDWIATIEGMYTRAVDDWFYINRALTGPQNTNRGRVTYGTIATSGFSTPSRLSARNEVYDIVNQSKDYSYSFTAGVQKRLVSVFGAGASYTYGRSYSVMDLTSSRAVSNWRFGRGLSTRGLEDIYTDISKFDQPHRILVNGSYTFPWRMDVSMIYRGESGSPYDYIYGGSSGRGDLNADGTNTNDLVYVPTSAYDPAQIRFASNLTAVQLKQQQDALEAYIDSEPCLREQRGRIMERNSCRSPWINSVNLAVRQSLPRIRGQNLLVQLDVFNFGNLLNKNFGRVMTTGTQGSATLFAVTGMTSSDPATQNPLVSFNTTRTRFIESVFSSNYRFQLSVRYSF